MEGSYAVQVFIAEQNENLVESELCHFVIDKTKPTVSIKELSKAEGGHGIYGREELPVVAIEVMDVSGPSEITYVIKDTSGHEKTGKLMQEDSGFISAKWQGTSELDLAEFADGRIEVRVSASDRAGNNSDSAVLCLYTDTRKPEVTFSFDTSDVKNEKYYACNKILKITVREDNFDTKCQPEVLTGNPEGYSFSGWKMNGGRAESTIEFLGDGTYEVAFECSDLAGNSSSRQILPGFTIDQTVPELKIQGIGNHSSNNGTVAPVINFYDENSDQNKMELTLEEGANGKINIQSMIHTTSGEDGTQITFDNFKQGMDGIYTLTAKVKDLAGNQSGDQIMFSVNRKGSVYRFSSRTKQLLEKVFVSHAEEVVIYEDNVDWLTYSELSCSYNGTLIEMEAGKDYTVDKTGGEDKRKQYTYKIPAGFFRKEGVYTIHIYSEDKASNIAVSDTVQKSPGFILDYTAPLISVANLEERGYYHEKEHEFTVVVSDNLLLDSVKYYLDDELVKEYNSDELEQTEGVLRLKTGSSGDYQTIKIEAADAAGNTAESKEWHVLVNPTRQTKAKSADRKKTLPVVREEYQQEIQREETAGSYGIMAVIILLAVIASAGISLGIRYYRRKTEKTFTKG